MLDPHDLTKITAVLDWEMVTVGDPLMDLGTTLGYWMSRDAAGFFAYPLPTDISLLTELKPCKCFVTWRVGRPPSSTSH